MAERVTAVGETTSLADWKRWAGQRVMIGIPGPSVDEDTKRLIREIKPVGFVLFKRNVEEPAQVRELNRELASLVDPHTPALLAVDQEGGRVQRVREPATVWPAMRVVGRAGDLTARVSRAMALELRAMGFNLNFAPDADVDSNPRNPVIGDRSFGERTRDVVRHVQAFVRAHQDAGVIACAKHFPGHGDTSVDSHLELPKVEKDAPELREVELPPFKAAIDAGVGSIMSAHVVFPVWDEELPATLSPRVIPRLVRKEWGWDGVVFSDDMEMKAVAGRWPVEQQVDLATSATVDVFLCCKEPSLQLEVFEALARRQGEDPRFARACETSAKRVHAMRVQVLKQELGPPPGLDVVGCGPHRELAMLATARGGG